MPLTDKDKLEYDVMAAHRAHDVETEFGRAANKAAVDSGTETLKALLYLNGGSCVVMLAFIGTLASKDKSFAQFGMVLLTFALGAGLAVLANAAGYFTNLLIVGTSDAKLRSYDHPYLHDTDKSQNKRCRGEAMRAIAVVLAFASLGSFFWGLRLAYTAFTGL